MQSAPLAGHPEPLRVFGPLAGGVVDRHFQPAEVFELLMAHQVLAVHFGELLDLQFGDAPAIGSQDGEWQEDGGLGELHFQQDREFCQQHYDRVGARSLGEDLFGEEAQEAPDAGLGGQRDIARKRGDLNPLVERQKQLVVEYDLLGL